MRKARVHRMRASIPIMLLTALLFPLRTSGNGSRETLQDAWQDAVLRLDDNSTALTSLNRLGSVQNAPLAKVIEVMEAQNGQEAETYRIEQELKFLEKN